MWQLLGIIYLQTNCLIEHRCAYLGRYMHLMAGGQNGLSAVYMRCTLTSELTISVCKCCVLVIYESYLVTASSPEAASYLVSTS
jgi:hypothetical protein